MFFVFSLLFFSQIVTLTHGQSNTTDSCSTNFTTSTPECESALPFGTQLKKTLSHECLVNDEIVFSGAAADYSIQRMVNPIIFNLTGVDTNLVFTICSGATDCIKTDAYVEFTGDAQNGTDTSCICHVALNNTVWNKFSNTDTGDEFLCKDEYQLVTKKELVTIAQNAENFETCSERHGSTSSYEYIMCLTNYISVYKASRDINKDYVDKVRNIIKEVTGGIQISVKGSLDNRFEFTIVPSDSTKFMSWKGDNSIPAGISIFFRTDIGLDEIIRSEYFDLRDKMSAALTVPEGIYDHGFLGVTLGLGENFRLFELPVSNYEQSNTRDCLSNGNEEEDESGISSLNIALTTIASLVVALEIFIFVKDKTTKK